MISSLTPTTGFLTPSWHIASSPTVSRAATSPTPSKQRQESPDASPHDRVILSQVPASDPTPAVVAAPPRRETPAGVQLGPNGTLAFDVGPTATAQSTLKVANEALDYVRTFGIRSQNNYTLPYDEANQVGKLLDTQLRPKAMADPRPATAGEFIKRYADLTRELKVGNCGEHARLAYQYLRDHGVEDVVLMSGSSRITSGGEPADHEFVVLGLDPRAELSNPSTWGDKAVILDPWMNLGKDKPVGFALPAKEGIKHTDHYFDTGYGIDYELKDSLASFPDSEPLRWNNVRQRI